MKVVKELDTNDSSEFEFDYDWEIYGSTQTPAFGCVDGLIK